jgi:Zn-dependent M16 (insulinase) family peptidase
MTALAHEVLTSAKLTDKARVTRLLQEYVKRDEQGIVPAANRFAAGRAARGYRPVHAIEDQMFGVSAVFWLREIAALAERDFDQVAAKISQAWSSVLKTSYEGLVVADSNVRGVAIESINELARSVGGVERGTEASAARTIATSAAAGVFEGLSIPSQVNYVARVVDCEAVGLKDHGANRVFRQLVWGNYLLDRVRFQGGAYGVSAGFNSSTNLFTCSSYRDPELTETLKVFRGIPDWFSTQELDADEIDRGVIAVIRDYDSPQSVFGKAASTFSELQVGYTLERKAQDRQEVLATDLKKLKEIASAVAAASSTEKVCVVGGEAGLKAAGFSVTSLVS